MADNETDDETGAFRSLLDTEDDPGPETIVLEELDLMATAEFQRFAKPEVPDDDDTEPD